VEKILKRGHSNENIPVMFFIMLYLMALTFYPMNETLKWYFDKKKITFFSSFLV